ncbi:MAG: DUF885 domain-containing protein [Clostridiales bacterium]|nr:DUF885 domain-containing protein [Clostridiales bacterium]
MKHLRRSILWLLALTMVLASLGCGGTQSSQSESERFAAYLDELYLEELSGTDLLSLQFTLSHPEELGITISGAPLGELSREDYEAAAKESAEEVKKLKSFDRSQLTPTEQVDYDALLWQLEINAENGEYALLMECCSPMQGVQANLPNMLVEFPIRDEGDIKDYLLVLEDVDDYFKQVIAFEKEKSAAGYFMSEGNAQGVIDSCKEFTRNKEDHFMILAFNDRIDGFDWLTAEQKAAYKESNRQSVLNTVIPAYEELMECFTELKSTGKNPGGLCGFEGGKEYYQNIVKEKTGSEKTPEEIITLLEDEMDAIMERMLLLALGHSSEVLNMYDAAPDVTDPEEILVALEERMKKNYPEIGKVQYRLNYVHPTMEDSTNPAFYFVPPLDAAEENNIYLNRKYTEDDPRYLFSTLAHEGYPGHLYQMNYFFASDAHPIRKGILNQLGYVEGWATYVENDSYYLMGLDDVTAELLQLDNRFSWALQCRLDIGINYEGWDVDDVEEALAAYLGDNAEEMAQTMMDVCSADPGIYLSYYVGYLEFMELKEYAMEQLGDGFDLVTFHKAILDVGAAPFKNVREAVKQYVAAAK